MGEERRKGLGFLLISSQGEAGLGLPHLRGFEHMCGGRGAHLGGSLTPRIHWGLTSALCSACSPLTQHEDRRVETPV